ncbi:MAG: diguanylate cyclase [Gammaproteobacteria bacterium]|nr:MAG: diguanylate cyclase [Gammaproteobacteria bacterium]
MHDMTEDDVPGPCREVELTLHDGTRRKVRVLEEEVPFPDGCLIFSRTNLDGRITDCNESFVLMSGYEEAELIGSPHCILRHPDMPAAAFQDLWQTVERGERWHGYVKNLRKDGRYYWVYASVIPNKRKGLIVSYTSVRRKPSRRQIAAVEEQYAALLGAST